MKRSDLSFASIAGQSGIKESLLRLVHSEDKPNSMVFSGPKGVGKLTCACAYAAACLCSQPTEQGACGKCNACLSFAAGMNPNVFFWFRKKQNTTIDQMRRLTGLAAYAPVGSRYKINVIQDGDSLNEEASNSILKTIEDSPDYLITLILYNNRENILPTIRSRSFDLGFRPLDTETVARSLSRSDDSGAFAARASGGSIGRALLLANAPCLGEARELAAETVFGVMRDTYALLSLSERIAALDFNSPEDAAEREKNEEALKSPMEYLSYPFYPALSAVDNIAEFCSLLALWLRDLLLVTTEGPREQLVNSDKTELLSKQAAAFRDPAVLSAMIREIWLRQDRLRQNANGQLTLEGMLCALHSICRPGRGAARAF